MRTRKLLVHLRQVATQLDKNLKDASKGDIKKMIEWVQSEGYSKWTQNDFKKAIKRFYKWLNDGEYPKKVEWINTTMSRNNGTLESYGTCQSLLVPSFSPVFSLVGKVEGEKVREFTIGVKKKRPIAPARFLMVWINSQG